MNKKSKRGGKREGAGRKPGPTAETVERKKLAASIMTDGGVTPLEIIITTMRDLWAEANQGERPNLGKRMQAVMMAEKAAPYLHPRLASVANKHSGDPESPIKTEATVQVVIVPAKETAQVHSRPIDPHEPL